MVVGARRRRAKERLGQFERSCKLRGSGPWPGRGYSRRLEKTLLPIGNEGWASFDGKGDGGSDF